MQDPYKSVEDRAFWSRAVAREFDPGAVSDRPPFTFSRQDTFMSAGSCFASNVRRYLESWGCTYTVAEYPHPQWPESRETLYYEAFSARYGNVYTARQMVQLLQRATGAFSPAEEYWVNPEGHFVDPFRPGLALRAQSLPEFRALTDQHLAAVYRAVEDSSVLVFTLGLTEAWYSADDGAVFPACPGTVSGSFDPDRHRFVNFTVDEITEDVKRMASILRSINPTIRIVLTVSPVPLVATATGRHVLVATTHSKAMLRVAADTAVRDDPGMAYFPAYEIVSGPQNQGTAFEADLRSVREETIETVMQAFATTYLKFPTVSDAKERSRSDATTEDMISQAFADECEEMMADDQLRPIVRVPIIETIPVPSAPVPTSGILHRLGAVRRRFDR